MKNILKHKNKIIVGTLIIAVLAFVYWWGGDSPLLRGWSSTPTTQSQNGGHLTAEEKIKMAEELAKSKENDNVDKSEKIEEPITTIQEEPLVEHTPSPTEKQTETSAIINNDNAEEQDTLIEQKTNSVNPGTPIEQKINSVNPDTPIEQKTNKVNSDALNKNNEKVQEKELEIDKNTDNNTSTPIPTKQPEEKDNSDGELTCTLSVRCDTILKNLSWLDEEKTNIVPKNGVIYAQKEVVFYEGESVFNVLLREMKKNKIHFEYVNTPIYNSAYIEGIGNLYEFDCGELSGWMYKVNGKFPSFGCSRYILEPGDKIEWVYTCDLGYDVGGQGGWQRDE